MKRVGIVHASYYPQHHHMCRDAETLVDDGYEVDVICLRQKGQKKQEVIHGVTVYRLPLEHHRRGPLRYIFEYSAFFLLTFWKLACLSIRRRYEVVEIDNLPDFLVFAALIPKIMGAKIILYFFELMPEVFAEQYGVSTDHRMVRLLYWFEKVSAKWADHIIAANGIRQKEMLTSRGVDGSKISVVLNVASDSLFSQSTGSENHASGSNNGCFYIITHSSLLERYGIQTLVRAAALLRGDIPKFKVNILGAGEYREKLEELSQSLGVTEYVRFTGWVPDEEMLSLIDQAHIGVVTLLPQKQPQMPNKLFQYLAMGKATVTTRLPAIEPYFDNNSVMYYEPESEEDLTRCILELYRNPEKRVALANSGSTAYDKYQWPILKHDYLQVYERLIDSRK